MSKHHSTISRRDFMKGLGVAGCGLGLSAAATPIFKDLDELTSSKNSQFERSWWVKERDFPSLTMDVDWDVLDHRKPFTITPLTMRLLQEGPRIERRRNAMLQDVKGDRLKDHAITETMDRVMNFVKGYAPVPLDQNIGVEGTEFLSGGPGYWGVPRWEGTPEENLRMIRAAMHYFGSPQVYTFEVNEYTKKLFTEEVAWGDVEIPQTDPNTGVITLPEKCRWGVIGAIKQNNIIQQYGLAVHEDGPAKGYQPHFAEAACYDAYIDLHIVSLKLLGFLRAIGYLGIDGQFVGSGRHDAIRSLFGQYAVPFAALSGLGEMSRDNCICSPEYGLSMRRPVLMLTDLPLAVTNPVDAGIFKFCHTCKICAEACPSGCLSTEDEPTWEINTFEGMPINRPGICSFKNDYIAASDFGCPRDCVLCQGVCPFNHPNDAMIHPIIRSVGATTSLFDGFFSNMERIAYPRVNWDIDEWWERNLNSWSGDAQPGFPHKPSY